jgi:hypothetical protein
MQNNGLLERNKFRHIATTNSLYKPFVLVRCLRLPLSRAVIYLKIFWLKVYAFGESYVIKWKIGVEFAIEATVDPRHLSGPLSFSARNGANKF